MQGDELDGVWRVERVDGLMPPLPGVRKRIAGDRGETRVGPLHWPFDVVGLELHYRGPLRPFVDTLRPDGEDAYVGRATLAGRTLGRFRMTRLAPRASTLPRRA
jgi:hypothetical protein